MAMALPMTLNDVLITFGRRDVLLIVGLGLLSVILWNVPFVKLLLYPFWLFNTFIHEFSHAFALGMTGRRFRGVVIDPSTHGVTRFLGSQGCISVSAGYLGSALFGGFLILLTTADLSARAALLVLGVLFAILCLFFVTNCFGIVAGLVLAGALCVVGSYLDDQSAAMALLFLAVQTILASFHSLFILIGIARSGQRRDSDAEIMERITTIPAVFWALLWCAVAIGILLWSVTVAYRDLPLR
jgi:Peptidase M50B-like